MFTKEDFEGLFSLWQDGKYVSADEIFTEVVSKKGNVYKVKKLHSQKEFFLVSDGKTHAHGDTLKKAKEDFEFKIISDKLKNEPIKKETIITVNHYRLITGACEFGVKSWMDRVFNLKERAKIESKGIKAIDLLPILKKNTAYGLERFEKLITF